MDADALLPLLHGEMSSSNGETTITIRPIRPTDRDLEQAFVRELSAASRYQRFLAAIKELSSGLLTRFTVVQFPDSMALIATIPADGGERQIGVARYAMDAGTGHAEFAVVVADDWQGEGIGCELLRRIIGIAEAAGIQNFDGLVLRDNARMLRLARRLGFAVTEYREDHTLVCIRKQLGGGS